MSAATFSMVRVSPMDVRSTRLITTPTLSSDMLSGARSYMKREQWPMAVQMNGESIVDDKQMRAGYLRLEGLLANEVSGAAARGNAVVAGRFNVPMNLGAAYKLGPNWSYHQADLGHSVINNGTGFASPYCIVGGELRGLLAVKNGGQLHSDEFGITTSILGHDGSFDEDAFLSTTSDPRHIVNLQYVFPPKHEDKSPNTVEELAAMRNEPNNITLVDLSGRFVRRDGDYLERAKDLVASYGWSKYDRTVLALSERADAPFEAYKFYKTSPQGIVDAIMQNTRVENPVIFGMTEGGSFGIGGIMGDNIVELGKKASYSRGPQGMIALSMETTPEVFTRIEEEDSKLPDK